MSISSLDEMPLKFREYEVEPWRSKGMHIMPVGNYVVLYTPNEDRQVVTINRVFYGGMDIPNQM
jgi:plasmid stabilization system protein ParE